MWRAGRGGRGEAEDGGRGTATLDGIAGGGEEIVEGEEGRASRARGGEVVGEVGEGLDGAEACADGCGLDEVEEFEGLEGGGGGEGVEVEAGEDEGREELEVSRGEGDGRGGDHGDERAMEKVIGSKVTGARARSKGRRADRRERPRAGGGWGEKEGGNKAERVLVGSRVKMRARVRVDSAIWTRRACVVGGRTQWCVRERWRRT